MTPLLYLFYAAFIGLVFVWPLSFFGHRFYERLLAEEAAKHAGRGGGH